MEKGNPSALDGLFQEIQTMKELWEGLKEINIKIENLRQTLISISEPKKIKGGLEDILAQLDSFPEELK